MGDEILTRRNTDDDRSRNTGHHAHRALIERKTTGIIDAWLDYHTGLVFKRPKLAEGGIGNAVGNGGDGGLKASLVGSGSRTLANCSGQRRNDSRGLR